ncbi:MAG: phytanoyl-CoA dioxygenase family protein [Pseudomonadota bacterium]|nr:phytanoyl-CoA dioxygenase family protein [Pseudomonadota bacterium]
MTGPDGGRDLVPWLHVRGRTFEEAVMAEKPLALVSWLLGKSCQISSNHRHVRVERDPPQGLHNGAPMVPDPVPDHAMTCKMMWVIDEFTCESGAVLVVPSSHERLRHLNPDAHRATVPQKPLWVPSLSSVATSFTGRVPRPYLANTKA